MKNILRLGQFSWIAVIFQTENETLICRSRGVQKRVSFKWIILKNLL